MAAKILILVEGEKTDVKLMNHLLQVYGIFADHVVVFYNTNIYTLYKTMFVDNDPDTVDLLQLLKSREKDPQKKLLFDDKYSDILLIFDLDPQDPTFTAESIQEMQAFFTESSDMGKLYLNYPMVESFYHMTSIPDDQYPTRKVSLEELWLDATKLVSIRRIAITITPNSRSLVRNAVLSSNKTLKKGGR